MALQFVLGGSGSGKSEYVQKLAFEMSKDRKNNIWMIVPDQFTMQTQWQMATKHPNGGILNIDVLSFSRLPRKIFEEVGQPKRLVLDDTGKCLLIRRAASKVKDNLTVLAKGIDNPGWPAEVKSVISEFMQYNISVDDVDMLIEKAKDNIPLRKKLSDLKLLYEGFLKECEDRYLTKEEMLDLVAERIPLSRKLEESVVIFDGFTGFTPIQIKVIAEIMKKVKDVIITFPFENDLSVIPSEVKKGNLFELTCSNIRDISRAAEEVGVRIKEDVRLSSNYRSRNNKALLHLESSLFRAKKAEGISSEGKVQIVRCGNIEHECHILCETLLNDIRNEGYRYRDVAVVCGDMEKYGKNLAKYLSRYDVPYYMDSNRNINNNLLVKYIKAAVNIMENRFRTEDVMSFLRTGLYSFDESETDELENYIYAAGIKGIRRWSEPFTYISDEMRRNEGNTDGMDMLRERFLDTFRKFMIDNSFKKRPLKDWVVLLYELLEDTGVYDKLRKISEEFNEAGRVVEAMEYAAVYDRVMGLFEQITDLMGEETYTVKELSDILQVGFSEIKVGVLPQKADSLLVGDMERTRLREIKALYFIGVNDGNIPRNSESGGLLSLPEKEFLKQDDEIRLAPTPAEKAFIEQLYLYLNVTKPTEKLYISYACVGTKGESLIPSYFTSVVMSLYTDNVFFDKSSHNVRLSYDDIKEETGRLVGLYAAGLTSREDEKQLLDNIGILKKDEENAKWCGNIIENAYREYTPSSILAKTARELYGTLLSVSVSTLESFAKCRFAHFAKYGLGLSEREEYGFENTDLGTMSHDCLEEIGKSLSAQKLDFSTATAEILKAEVERAIDKITVGNRENIINSDAKNKYYITELKRIMNRTVDTLGYQLSKGKFTPAVYEQPFSRIYEFEDEELKGVKVNLKGRIDRIDLCEESEEREIVKIIDYKSSSRKFDPEALEAGVSLQLAIYMRSAIDTLKEMHPDKDVRPGAMFYYAIDDPFVADSADSEKLIREKLIPTGAFVNDDKVAEALDSNLLQAQTKSDVVPASKKKDNSYTSSSSVYGVDEFETMINRARDIALENAGEIIKGAVEINPLSEKQIDACKYCMLKGVCGFDSKIPGYRKRGLKGETVMDDENEEE